MESKMISSSSNANIKNVISLQKKGKTRKEQDAFVVEGIKMVLEAPWNTILQLFVSESFINQKENQAFLEKLNCKTKTGLELLTVTDRIFQEMADTQTPQGILAVIQKPHYTFSDLFPKKGKAQIVVLEELQDPGNLGTIIRAGEGAGVSGVILLKGTVDLFNPKVIRSTMGSIYRVPFFFAEDLTVLIPMLQKRCIIYASCLNGKQEYDQMDFTKDIAFLIGNEANGLSKAAINSADKLIRIPMLGQVESLNAAVAASVLMYEAGRQRRKKGRN